jgi:hypothetical protein
MVAIRRYDAALGLDWAGGVWVDGTEGAAGPGRDVAICGLGEQPAIPRMAPGNRIKDRMAQFRVYTLLRAYNRSTHRNRRTRMTTARADFGIWQRIRLLVIALGCSVAIADVAADAPPLGDTPAPWRALPGSVLAPAAMRGNREGTRVGCGAGGVGTRIFATRVVHGGVPAIAYRVELDNVSIAFSGDTDGNNGNLERRIRVPDRDSRFL